MCFGHPLSEEQIAFVRKHFSDMRNQDLADAAGISKSSVSKIQKAFHLRKSPEQMNRMLAKAGRASVAVRDNRHIILTPEIIEKRVASYKKTFREELIRTKWGLEQLTKMKVRQEPRKKRRQRSYLKQLGYVLDEPNCTAYWTDNTTRAVRMEQYTDKKCYYKFKPLYENEQHQREPGIVAVAGE